jgi:hypothetical protein
MKHLNLKGFALASAMVLGGLSANAQVYQPKAFLAPGGAGTDNFYSNYVGLRFTISNPALDVAYTVANDGSTTGQWGGAVTGTLTGPISRASDTSGCTSLTSLTGKIALIYRGNCEFGAKALAAEQAGAIACIIVNNIPGGPVGMAAGSQGGSVTIPVFMISQADGDLINNVLINAGTSTATIVPWNSGAGDEIAIIKGGSALWSSYAIPKHQMGTNNGNPAAYKMQPGAYIANFGTSDQTNVRYDSKILWTPSGSTTATTVATDNETALTFNALDSIIAIYTDVTPDLHATTTGRFDIVDSISSAADNIAGNNVVTNSVYVTDNIFCKSRYDFTKNEPISNIGFRAGTGDPITWGPLFYVAKGGHSIDKLQFAISSGTAGPISGLNQLMVILKWQDGSNGGPLDGLVDNVEVSIAGSASRNYTGTTADSSGAFVTADVDVSGGPVVLEDNTWYWVVAELQTNFFLGCDGVLNYLPRSVLYNVNVPAVYEQFAPIYFGDFGELQANTDGAFPFPFDGTADLDTVRFANQKQGVVPSIAMITSMFPTSVENTTATNTLGDIQLAPNPATDKLSVTVSLAQQSEKATYRVLSVLGQVMTKSDIQNVQNNTFDINTSSYDPGNYYVLVTVGEKTIYKKFTVIAK